MNESKVSVVVWNGKHEKFFSKEGAAYINLDEKIIRTAFRSDEYIKAIIDVLEVLKNEN